jgi:hypothetical protein
MASQAVAKPSALASKESATGSKRQSSVSQGELLGIEPVERFDPEGSKDLKGSGGRQKSRERWRSAQTTGRGRGIRPVTDSKPAQSGGA